MRFNKMVEEKFSKRLEEYFRDVLEPELIQEIIREGTMTTCRRDDILIDYGQFIQHMPLILEGSLRITREGEDGNELFLYYLTKGETCAFSMSCCIQSKKSEIMAIAEEDSKIWMVPVKFMSVWLNKYETWKEFVFNSYNKRFEEMLSTIDSIAFLKMDERLERYLEGKRENADSNIIYKTHQEIAQELNTSRVVISRLLKQLENSNKIKLFRNRIQIN